MSRWSIQNFFTPTRNPFVLHALPTAGFSCVAQGVDIWAFPDELELAEARETTLADRTEVCATWRHPKTGLAAEITYRFFPDTNTLEYGGVLRHDGTKPLTQFRGPFSLAYSTRRQDTGIPRVFSLTGGGSCDSTYPTPTFAPRECDLTGPLTLRSGEGGVSTQRDMPLVIMTTQDEAYGMVAALEWPSFWMGFCAERVIDGDPWSYILLHLDKTNFILNPGDTIPLPGVILGFFEGGLLAGSQCLRRHIRRHVTPSIGGEKIVPPVFYNHWFGCGNNISTTTFKPIVDIAADLGVEHFVIDTGWFEGGFGAGRGNWEKLDRKKFPEGMDCFARYVEAKGMTYGTWLEVEYAVIGTDWPVRHPDWFRTCRSTSDQLLRLDDPAVCGQVMEFLERFISTNHVSWLRWDFNTHPGQFWEGAEEYDNQGWLQLRYSEGLFKLLDDLLARFPSLHLEACAGGGHRMDLGTLRRAHSCWMNDNSATIPAVRSRLKGMNRYLPGNYGNSCLCNMEWGGDPSDRNKLPRAFFDRGYPLDFLRSRMGGSLGFSENFTNWNRTTVEQVRQEIARYKTIRRYLLEDFYPLFQPRGVRDWDGWQFHDPRDGSGFLMAFRNQAQNGKTTVVPGGWENGVTYQVEDVDTGRKQKLKGGDEIELGIETCDETIWLRYAPV